MERDGIQFNVHRLPLSTNDETQHDSLTENKFCIEVNELYTVIPIINGETVWNRNNWENEINTDTFDIKCDDLLSRDEEKSKQTALTILQGILVDIEDDIIDDMVHDILSLACEMAEEFSGGVKVLRFAVDVDIVMEDERDDDEIYEDVEMEIGDDEEDTTDINFSDYEEEDERLTDSEYDEEYEEYNLVVPASKSIINKLQQVEVKGWMDTTCSICLAEMNIGSFVTCLPCNALGAQPGNPHLFHCTCIEKWLDKNNVCPLCRSIVIR